MYVILKSITLRWVDVKEAELMTRRKPAGAVDAAPGSQTLARGLAA
jgi:hypothetical protein